MGEAREHPGFSLFDLLLFPVALPWKELMFIAGEIGEMAEREWLDPETLRNKLIELQLRYEMGEIPEEEYRREWDALSARLRDLQAVRRAEEG